MAEEDGALQEEHISSGTSCPGTKISKRKLKRLQVEAASKLRCKLCADKTFTSLKMYDDHMASRKHRNRKLRKDALGAWVCEACDLTLSSHKEWTKHLCGRRHHDKLKEWSTRLFVTSSPVTQQEIDLLDDSHYEETEEETEEDAMTEL